MIKEDFYKLHIGQEIFFSGQPRKITALVDRFKGEESICLKSLEGDSGVILFDDIKDELSFEPPKKKVKKYLWAYPSGSSWLCSREFYTESEVKNGDNTVHWIRVGRSMIEVEEQLRIIKLMG